MTMAVQLFPTVADLEKDFLAKARALAHLNEHQQVRGAEADFQVAYRELVAAERRERKHRSLIYADLTVKVKSPIGGEGI